jgi:hypothetical protein
LIFDSRRYTMTMTDLRNARARLQGRALQILTMKTMLKAPRTKRLKLKHDEAASIFALKFNLRRYSKPPTHQTF